MRYLWLFLLSGMLATPTFAQRSWEWFVVPNVNLHIPLEGDKQVYPILGYNKKATPKVLIGGFGIGASAFRVLTDNKTLKAQANLSKHTYWDESFELTDSNNAPLGTYVFGSSDFSLGLSTTAHHLFSEKFSVGVGLGAQLFTTTLSRLPGSDYRQLVGDEVSVNRHYKQFLPVVPLEISRKGESVLLNVRYEHGLINRYKKEMAAYKTDRFGLLYFEVGFKVR